VRSSPPVDLPQEWVCCVQIQPAKLRLKMSVKYYIKTSENKYYQKISQYEDLRSKAKSFKDFGKVKLHLLFLVGHFNNTMSGNVPEWLYNSNPIPTIPTNWHIVKNDNDTEETIVFDIHGYIDRQTKLKELSAIYGAAVKELYKKLEDNDDLQNYQIILVFQHKIKNNSDLKTIVDQIKDALKTGFINRNDYKRVHKNYTTAIAFRELQKAMIAKLAFDGDATMSIIDIKNLVEIATEIETGIINGAY
jgi:hypothetical protein